MQNRRDTLILVALAIGALVTSTPAAAQAVSQDETFRLTEVAKTALPVLIEEEDGCRDEVVSGTLTLEADGDWVLVTQEREVCGDRVEEDEDREEGRFRIEGTSIHFLGDDDDEDEDSDDDEIDLEDLTTGTRTAAGLTVRLGDSDISLVFRQ